MNKLLTLLSILIVLVSAVGLFSLTIASAQISESQDYVPGQVLVKFKDNTPGNAIAAELKRHNAKVLDKIIDLNVLVLGVPESQEGRVIAALSKNPNVEYAEVNGLAFALLIPNDTYFASNQWGLENTGQVIKGTTGVVDADIDGPTAWDTTQGGVPVAILDTGIDQDHEDLSSKIVLQKNFTDSLTIDDLYGHGTHVGGIVAAITNNNTGVAGGCPNCQLMNGKVLNDSGSGAYSWIANGVTWAANNNAKVINLSLGGSFKSQTLENAVNYAWNKGSIVVAAAGNCGCQAKIYPAAYQNAIAVAATNNKDQKASFSSYGAKWVDVAAPGQDIFSTFPNHPYKINKSLNYDFGSGTSMATPFASAVAALIWSTPYGTSASSVRTRLELTADKIPGTGNYWSSGRINAANAVAP
ncbi:S8 family serine peptidase [Candidatus Daviesbacteria bacterium]|nr:S8 family serine peptidase [Candidatus Daviesbacteria bacterium]